MTSSGSPDRTVPEILTGMTGSIAALQSDEYELMIAGKNPVRRRDDLLMVGSEHANTVG